MRFRYASKRQSARGVINTLFKREDYCGFHTNEVFKQNKHLVFRVLVTRKQEEGQTRRRVKK